MARSCCCSARRELAFGASIVAVRVWPAADYTRVTIESDAALSRSTSWPRTRRARDRRRRPRAQPALRETGRQGALRRPVHRRRAVGQNQPRVVRLVIDLKQPTAPQLFTLAPVAAYQHRLVFDLYPTRSATRCSR
jgi:N-acetylmuramoyl-L-alanine amidase